MTFPLLKFEQTAARQRERGRGEEEELGKSGLRPCSGTGLGCWKNSTEANVAEGVAREA